jgi:hypothetical protein
VATKNRCFWQLRHKVISGGYNSGCHFMTLPLFVVTHGARLEPRIDLSSQRQRDAFRNLLVLNGRRKSLGETIIRSI